MNEIELLKSQLAAERQHLEEIAARCRGGNEQISIYFTANCIKYLLFSIKNERARLEAHAERSRDGADARSAQAIERLRRAFEQAEAAAARLPALPESAPSKAVSREDALALTECAELIQRSVEARTALEALEAPRYTVDDWRRIARLDADSILEERRLRTGVLGHGAGDAR